GIELTVTRQVLGWFDPPGDAASLTLGRFPCWFIETEPPYGHYGFPITAHGQRGLKIALHKPGYPIVPDQLGLPGHDVREGEVEALREVLRSCLPGGDGPLLATRICLYTNSADQHFIVGPHPGFERVTLAAGFSGHGFKFASVMGEVLAELALDGATRHPIAFLSPDRFGP
nr:FAD-dependent oxidoreductase [Akkermansiaceae bacterium]